MKRIVLKTGDVFEIKVPGKGYGYARLLGKDDFAPLFEIFDPLFKSPLEETELGLTHFKVRTIVYINPAGVKADWSLRLRGFPGNTTLPTRFFGSPRYGWTIISNGRREEVGPRSTSYEKLLDQGYVHQVLWLPPSIEKYLSSDEPLHWNQWPA